jgi:hypothetical protein
VEALVGSLTRASTVFQPLADGSRHPAAPLAGGQYRGPRPGDGAADPAAHRAAGQPTANCTEPPRNKPGLGLPARSYQPFYSKSDAQRFVGMAALLGLDTARQVILVPTAAAPAPLPGRPRITLAVAGLAAMVLPLPAATPWVSS